MRKVRLDTRPLYVTRPFLPPLEEFTPYLEKIWNCQILTNNGPFHQQLEQQLCEYLGVKYISLFSNGTLALMVALKALKISGEVITTPFSFVATSQALLWNNIKPVFIDIEEDTFNLDPDKIEEAISPKTTAILPVHIFGNTCKTVKIEEIAHRNGLKVIYDAAHSFGVRVKGTSVVNFGDLSVLSFHAIKVFNTFEGGAVVCHNKEMKQYIDQLKNFGIKDEATVVTCGINAKMNEFQAALGLLQLKHIDSVISKREIIASLYKNEFKNINGIIFQNDILDILNNYAFFPILIDPAKFGRTRDEIYFELKKQNIFGKRYFYPLISQMPLFKTSTKDIIKETPIAARITEQVICLPIYPGLDGGMVKRICNAIKVLQKSNN